MTPTALNNNQVSYSKPHSIFYYWYCTSNYLLIHLYSPFIWWKFKYLCNTHTKIKINPHTGTSVHNLVQCCFLFMKQSWSANLKTDKHTVYMIRTNNKTVTTSKTNCILMYAPWVVTVIMKIIIALTQMLFQQNLKKDNTIHLTKLITISSSMKGHNQRISCW